MERGKNCVERNGSKRLPRSLGGGLRSWLAVRETRTAALNLTAPPLLRLAAPATGDPRRCGGVDEAACGARKKSRRAEPPVGGRPAPAPGAGDPLAHVNHRPLGQGKKAVRPAVRLNPSAVLLERPVQARRASA